MPFLMLQKCRRYNPISGLPYRHFLEEHFQKFRSYKTILMVTQSFSLGINKYLLLQQQNAFAFFLSTGFGLYATLLLRYLIQYLIFLLFRPVFVRFYKIR